MGCLPFRFHPFLFFSKYLLSFIASAPAANLPAPIVVNQDGYFRGAIHMFMCGKSTPIRSTTDDYEVDAEHC